MKKAIAFMKKYPVYHATIHAIGGIGVGILIANPLAGIHPVRWGVTLLVIAILGHLYAWFS
ncbi:MAG TPA: hypothetical protein VKC53_03845 [Patescibacteria group bacterium]|nr:hypothetical protein [Patescibacteria group bacterium]